MSTDSGVACQCKSCARPQWYDHGDCQGCGTDKDIESTWVATKPCKGSTPSAAPARKLCLESGACAQLVDIWTDLVLVRGLSPYLMPAGQAFMQYSSPPWYVERGVDVTVQCSVPSDPGFADKLNRAGAWTNQSLLVRIMATFETFAGVESIRDFQLPNRPGMREFHHARRLRNKIAHGDALTDQRLVDEAQRLFGPRTVVGGRCNLDISLVLEPLWARLLLYARSLENGLVVPERPAVVVVADDAGFTAQTLDGVLRVNGTGARRRAGEVISLCGIA